jgi:preprotein translocase subunit SecG
MGFFIGLLTFVMVLDCLLLVLLVLIQLPKKDAGAGLAFGGGATDALFGAGSGNVLTKITKYAAGIFFGLALLIGILQKSGTGTSSFEKGLTGPGRAPTTAFPPPSTPATPGTGTNAAAMPTTGSNFVPPLLEAPTSAPAAAPVPVPAVAVTNASPQSVGSNSLPPK